MKSLHEIVNSQYIEYPWAVSILQSSQGQLLSIIIKHLEDERQDTVIDGHDEELH